MKHLWFEKGAYASKAARQYLNGYFNPLAIKKIAVIRHAALGDQVIVRPFLIEARKFFPHAEITLVTVSNYLYGTPTELADKTVVMKSREDSKHLSLKQKWQDYSQLEEQDIIFDVAGTNRSYWMTLLTKAKLKVGFPYTPFLCGTLYNLAVFRSDFQPEVECMLDMLKILGHNPSYPLDFAYPDNRQLCDFETPYLVYFSGASQLRKILSKPEMRAVIEQTIEQQPNVKHIFLEGKNEFEKGEYLQDLAEAGKLTIQPCLPLDELVTFIAKATLVIAPDTGIRNVAISTHTPTVGIFYATVPFRYTPLYETHTIVMNANGEKPSTEQITAAITATLKLRSITVKSRQDQ
ncbi:MULTISPECIES: glycosyltransferase family 9 protein [Vibrio]|uniref:glycosyltransferase family 9 protein n=1 Tax=Vibrio TaxID=662 RepID=UPI0021C44C49|nr:MULTISPECIES: glycosyltransferase family 9 protein [Vibrio]MDE1248425.1 glycosyltransferase family 9 protein [Vibrio aestuarianus]MDE1251596.1 glycosyltransferase family 9 protein [Vibrio aestuarianus]MDE1319369.1 glycosyltransferase family 9 protein [Vibrio aestuarianus]MDF9399697.1 lipopolysaccharide heptosyltransferase family protein [Vibrio sp. 1180_3]CAH8242244.1 Lipopolysaccharide biosynthesis protein [Vibrio aestuarianus]